MRILRRIRYDALCVLSLAFCCLILAACSAAATNQMTKQEADEYLKLDDWVNVRTMKSSDGLTSEVVMTKELDEAGLPTSTCLYDEDGDTQQIEKLSYDDEGNLTRKDRYGRPSDGGLDWSGAEVYIRDDSGRLVETDTYGVFNTLSSRSYFEYSEDGVLQGEANYSVDADGEDDYLSYEYKYNDGGDEVYYASYRPGYSDPNLERAYEYDQCGRVISYRHLADGVEDYYSFEYGTDGQSRTTYKNGEFFSEDKLDACGNEVSGFALDSNCLSSSEYNQYSQRTHYKSESSDSEIYRVYDNQGLQLAMWISTPEYITAYTYDYVNKRTGEQVDGGDPVEIYNKYPLVEGLDDEATAQSNNSASYDINEIKDILRVALSTYYNSAELDEEKTVGGPNYYTTYCLVTNYSSQDEWEERIRSCCSGEWLEGMLVDDCFYEENGALYMGIGGRGSYFSDLDSVEILSSDSSGCTISILSYPPSVPVKEVFRMEMDDGKLKVCELVKSINCDDMPEESDVPEGHERIAR